VGEKGLSFDDRDSAPNERRKKREREVAGSPPYHSWPREQSRKGKKKKEGIQFPQGKRVVISGLKKGIGKGSVANVRPQCDDRAAPKRESNPMPAFCRHICRKGGRGGRQGGARKRWRAQDPEPALKKKREKVVLVYSPSTTRSLLKTIVRKGGGVYLLLAIRGKEKGGTHNNRIPTLCSPPQFNFVKRKKRKRSVLLHRGHATEERKKEKSDLLNC